MEYKDMNAIGIVRLMLTDGVITVEQAAKYFPELKESEDADEKVRKALIKLVTNHASMDLFIEYDIHLDEVLAWLEKQGEQKPLFSDSRQRDPWEYIEEFKIRYGHYPKDADEIGVIVSEIVKKQGEQKPTDKVEPKFKVGDVVTNKKSKDTVKIVQILHDSYCYSGWDGAATVHSDFSISKQDDWELVEQNTAWSEEDERKLDNAIIQLQAASNIIFEDEVNESIAFIKSLKERVQPQPKQGWSEEDEMMIKFTLTYFRTRGALEDSDIIKWLKSLKGKIQSLPKQE